MSKNCNVIAIFPIYGQFGVIRKPDSGRIVCKIYILMKSNLLSYKNWKQNYEQNFQWKYDTQNDSPVWICHMNNVHLIGFIIICYFLSCSLMNSCNRR